MAKDPKQTWTFEEAKAEQDKVIASNPKRAFDPDTPLFQWSALHEIAGLHERFQKDDKYALMLAVRACANHDLVMPKWVATAYINAFDTVQNYYAKSWDDVFGKPMLKGANMEAKRKKRYLEFAVLNEVHSILSSESPKPPIDGHLFERVGQKLYIGKTLATEYYYSVLKRFPFLRQDTSANF